jgi:hypothetical protein
VIRVYFILVFLSALGSEVYSQTTTLKFIATWQGESVVLGKQYFSTTLKDSIQFDRLRFYISDLTFVNDSLEKPHSKQHILLDFEKSTTINLDSSMAFEGINFKLGIDSITNVSGAFGGDLDPTVGMYWSWQSGYVNFKLEGKSNALRSSNRKFQFHLGGYSFPNKNVARVSLKTNKNSQNIIELPLDLLFKEIDLSVQNTIMSPSLKAVEMTQTIAGIIQIQK